MAREPKKLYQGQPGTTNTDLYVVPAGKKATVTSMVACNTNAATKYFSLYNVDNGDTIADDTAMAKMQKLDGTGATGGGGLWGWEIPFPLNAVGDKISGIQETAGAITVTIWGFEEAA